MHALKAHVTGGLLVVDGPGVAAIAVPEDDLTAEERLELHASLDRAMADSEAGRGMDAWQFLEQLRVRRASNST
jgi:hypothetical protein